MSLTRPVVPSALIVAYIVCAGTTSAEPVAGETGCEPSRGALAFLGCSLAKKLGPRAHGARVSIVELKSDRELPSPATLRERLEAAVSSALAVSPAEVKPSEPRKLTLELSVEKNGGMLGVTADLRRAIGLWQRIRHRKAAAEQHAFVEIALDAELRSMIPPPPLVVSETIKLKAPERGVVALACGPLGSDGGQELALVSRRSIRVGRIAGRRFVERKNAAWTTLSAVAPVPLREPIVSAEITPQGTLRVGSTDRKDGLELSGDLAVTVRFDAVLPVAGGCAARSGTGLLAQVAACTARPRSSLASSPALVDAIVGAPDAWIARDLANATLLGARPEISGLALRAGAELAWGDADDDGAPELAYSADTLDANKDRLTVVTLKSDKVVRRFELAAPGIGAIAICHRSEGAGMAPIVLATGDELWLIR